MVLEEGETKLEKGIQNVVDELIPQARWRKGAIREVESMMNDKM